MKFLSTNFSGLFVLEYDAFIDDRGFFLKTYNEELFGLSGIQFSIKESYFSSSKKGVIRGMHFQLPPHDHDKLVYVSKGKIIDVVLDLRKNSDTFGKYFSIELSSDNNKALFIPAGFAHGFYSLEDDSLVFYSQSTCYNKENDSGIRYDSFGFVRPEINDSLVSTRDKSLIPFNEFQSPFI